MINSRTEAYIFLASINAPDHLITHVKLVGEAADLLIEALEKQHVPVDFEFIRTGVAIHDIGKTIHTHEMTGAGSEHEPAGQKILLDKGISPKLARVCLSHARWKEMDCSLEELLIALSDKLWKGKREEALELDIVDKIADVLAVERWDIFAELDTVFEEIASGGHQRLQRSISSSLD